MNSTARAVEAQLRPTDTFDRLESAVRSYCRSIPTVFDKAQGAELIDVSGGRYLDFLSGAGSLNYGHNHPALRDALIDYIASGGITHSLDLHTRAKARFLESFRQHILAPRRMSYRAQFPGPTGANAVEAAIKLARKVTGRQDVVTFTNGFHGVTLGALSLTGNEHHRAAAGVALPGALRAPFDGYLGTDVDTLDFLEKALGDASSGFGHPAAVIVETVQGEGGLNVAGVEWLRRLERVCRERKILLIVDDIQAGCGRTGTFFSFEPAGIRPDIVTLSKSLSGMGLPLALVLIDPQLDQWQPGEHNGTFRGNNHAFVTATAAIETFWRTNAFEHDVRRKSGLLRARLRQIKDSVDLPLTLKGRGLMTGLACPDGTLAGKVCQAAFRRGLVIETSGPDDSVVKCLPALTISDEDIERGLSILSESFKEVARR
jgi:diaminobutyrate-2-oxoglutarate transaminase